MPIMSGRKEVTCVIYYKVIIIIVWIIINRERLSISFFPRTLSNHLLVDLLAYFEMFP